MQHIIILPDLGQTTSEAKVVKWWKRAGEHVNRGDPILEVETDKVNMDVEAFESGYVRDLLVEEGATVAALSPIAILTDTPEEAFSRPDGGPPATSADSPGPSAVAAPSPGAKIKAAPRARALASELGIDLSAVAGTGPNGLITGADVERFAGRGNFRALSAMAATVVSSKRDIPHFYASRDVNVTTAAGWRTNWNERHPDLHASFNDVFVRTAARALRDVPRMNVSLRGGIYETRTVADVLLVAAHDEGLLLIPLPDPAAGSWESFLVDIRQAVKRGAVASAAPLLAISNLGMFGIKQFAAIIPPSCTAVLAIGAVREEPVAADGRVTVERMCTVTLSADHRIVDGITAARFLERVQDRLNSL